MPQTILDLGKLVKKKYPEEYDDISDIELGRKVKAKYPGDYDDFIDLEEQPKGPQKSGFVESAVRQVNPLPFLKSLVTQPGQTAKAFVSSIFTPSPDVLAATGQTFPQIVTAPFEEALQQASEGNIRGAAGTMTGAALPFVLPALRRPIARSLERSAARSYGKILEPTSQLRVGIAEEISPQLAKTKTVAASRKSMISKMKAGREQYGPLTETAFEKAPAVSLKQAGYLLEKVRERNLYIKGTQKVAANRADMAKVIDSIEADLMDLADKQGNIPAQIMDNFVDDLNKGLTTARGDMAQVAPATRKMMEKASARTFRQLLDTSWPSGKQINAMYRMYEKSYQMIEFGRRARVTAESAMKSGSSKGFGAAVKKALPGPVRELPNAVSNIFDSVPWATVTGATKQAMAEALASGNFTKVANLAIVAYEQAIRQNPQYDYEYVPGTGLRAVR